VIAVTTLADDGPGSLRQALSEKEPRIVVFRVGGVIALKKDLLVSEPFVTIAGQSAPGDGICLTGAGLRITTHDVVVRYLRVRVGDDPAGPNPENRDGIAIANRESAPHHIVLDHCSVSWAIDENVQLWYRCHDVTIQWCLIAESLEKSLHPKGAHGMGMLVGDHAQNVSVHHTLFAHNMDRNPLLKGDTATEVVNNVIYNWRNHGTSLGDPEGSGPHRADIIANLYLPGPQSPKHAGITLHRTTKPETSVYVLGTRGPGREQETNTDEWAAVLNQSPQPVRSDQRVLDGDRVSIELVSGLQDRVLASVGATAPSRDPVDARIVQSVRDRAGSLINTPREVGGWPSYRASPAPVDSDRDGMPDSWEERHALNPRDAADASRTAPSGYTWIEEYLNELAR
jgi:pectate lyase